MRKKKPLDSETQFLSGLIELSYGRDVLKKLRKWSAQVSWAQGWPEEKKAFWNAEAFMWHPKIEKEKRALIKKELAFLEEGISSGKKNLDLGCGSYSYLPSVGFDFSEKMLQFNENCTDKRRGDLEQRLPFADKEFDSVTAILVLNYVKNYPSLLREIKRVLKGNGIGVIVLSSAGVQPWPKQQEVNHFSAEKWKKVITKAGLVVEYWKKEGLCFFKLTPRKN